MIFRSSYNLYLIKLYVHDTVFDQINVVYCLILVVDYFILLENDLLCKFWKFFYIQVILEFKNRHLQKVNYFICYIFLLQLYYLMKN